MYLIDTHILLWSLYDSSLLSENTKKVLEEEECYVSIASLWEMSIKSSIGKLKLKQSIQEIADTCRKYGIQILNISPKHCDQMMELPLIHRDPFDRIIISQAKVERCTIITKDQFIPQYDVRTLW